MENEFGRGLCYCLALFLCHSERDMYGGNKKLEEESDERFRKYGKTENYSHVTELWFSGASDHVYDLEIPETLPKTLQTKLKRFQSKVLNWGHGLSNTVEKKDKVWAINEAKELIRSIDRHYGIKTEKATYS